jgi:hypothetical protein
MKLIVDLKILKYLHEQLEFTTVNSDPAELTIVFKIKDEISLLHNFRKYLIYFFTLLIEILSLLGIMFVMYSVFGILRGMIYG